MVDLFSSILPLGVFYIPGLFPFPSGHAENSPKDSWHLIDCI